jgi:hypothetical protein
MQLFGAIATLQMHDREVLLPVQMLSRRTQKLPAIGWQNLQGKFIMNPIDTADSCAMGRPCKLEKIILGFNLTSEVRWKG